MFFSNDLFRSINNAFANMDIVFRDLEKSHNTRGLFPVISIPSILHAINENITVDQDNEKTIYYKNGKVHREDGPAIEYKDREDEYWLEGKQVTKQDVEALVAKRDDEKEHTVYIGEREYKVKGKKKLEEIQKLLK